MGLDLTDPEPIAERTSSVIAWLALGGTCMAALVLGGAIVMTNRGGEKPANPPAVASGATGEIPATPLAANAKAEPPETTVRPQAPGKPRPKLPPLTATTRAAMSGEEVYQRLLKSTVFILSADKDVVGRVFVGAGSGVLLHKDRRLVVTNYHVVGERDRVLVFFPAYAGGTELTTRPDYYVDNAERLGVRARVVERSSTLDLAILELDSAPASAVALPLARSNANPGAQVYSVGASGIELRDFSGSLWRLSHGTVRGRYRETIHFKSGQSVTAMFLETQKPVNSGDSGGPTVNDRGELVGLVSSGDRSKDLVKHDIDLTEVRDFLIRYARRDGWVWVDAPAVAPPAPPPAVLDTLVAVLKDGEAADRVAAARRLGALGDTAQTAVPSLLAVLDDANAELTDAVSLALARIGPPPDGADTALIRALGSKATAARLYAARSLAQFKELPTGALPLLVAAFPDRSPGVRIAAVRAVARAGPAARTAALAPAFDRLGDEDEGVRAAAAALLTHFRPLGKADLALLRRKLEHPDALVRVAAAADMAALIDEPREASDIWRPLLRDSSPSLRAAAVRGLAQFPAAVADAAADLAKLFDDEDEAVQLAALAAAIHVKDSPKVTDAVAAVFRRTGKANVRGAAAAALVHVVEATPDRIPLLRELYQGGNTQAKTACLARFGTLATDRYDVAADLSAGLADANAGIRAAALQALAGAPDMARTMVKAMREVMEKPGEDDAVMMAAVSALGVAGRDGFLALTDLTSLTTSKAVAVHLCRELTKTGDKGTVAQAWMFRQAEAHEEFRAILLSYLPKHGNRDTVRELLPRTDFYKPARPGEKPHTYPTAVRKWAVTMLGELDYTAMPADAAVARLRVLAGRKDDPDVHGLAEVALRKIGRQ